MKTKLLSSVFLALTLGSGQMSAKDVFDLTFKARGESSVVDKVTVENLTQGTSMTLNGDYQLRLQRITSIADVTELIGIYLNDGAAQNQELWDLDGDGFISISDITSLIEDYLTYTAPKEAKVVDMDYDQGDMLRFTATSGQMKTIVMNQPTCTHDITFDFYKCQDANGYNYTTVRIGDMIWMAEDLRPVDKSKVQNLVAIDNASLWKSSTVSGDSPLMFTSGGEAYYNLEGARRCLPEGWKLPTNNQIEALANALGSYETAGDLLKDRTYNWITQTSDVDSISFAGRPMGWVNDKGEILEKDVQGCWVTGSTANRGMPCYFKVYQANSKLENVYSNPGTNKKFGFRVRGVHTAASVYSSLIDKFVTDKDRETEAKIRGSRKAPGRFKDNGPLGSYYELGSGRQSVWFNYNGRQFSVSKNESRSGELWKTENSSSWTFAHNCYVAPLEDDDDFTCSRLRKMAAQDNEYGYQNMLYAEYSVRFRVWNGDKNLLGSTGTVLVYSTADSEHNFTITKNTLKDANGNDYKFTMPKLDEDYMKWDTYDSSRGSESRHDFYTRCFNLKCINDLNGDGIGEIVMNVGTKVAIFDGKTYKLMRERNYTDGSSTGIGFSALRVEVADVDNDGRDDVLVLAANSSSSCRLYIYANGEIESNPKFTHKISRYGVFNDLKVGNVTGGEFPDIVILTRDMHTDHKAIARYGYVTHIRLKNTNGEAGGKADGIDEFLDSYEYDGFGDMDNDDKGHIGNTNVTMAYLRGQNYNQDVVIGKDLWRYVESEGKIKPLFPIFKNTYDGSFSIWADAICAVDVNGKGVENIYFYHDWNVRRDDEGIRLCTFGEKYLRDTSKCDKEDDVTTNINYNTSIFKYSDSGKQWSSDQKDGECVVYHKGSAELCTNPIVAPVRSREKVRKFAFKDYQRCYSSPIIYALISAPPYFEGYNDQSDYGETVWGKSKSVNHSEETANTWSAAVVTGFEVETNIPVLGTKIGGIDCTVKITGEWSNTDINNKSTSYGISYAATETDCVVLQLAPYDMYTYTVIDSDNPDDNGAELIIAMPQEHRFLGLTLSDYSRLAADMKGAPQLNKIFKHTPGKPFTYVSSPDMIQSNVKNEQVLWGRDVNDKTTMEMVGSGAKVTRSISLSHEKGSGFEQTYGGEVEIVSLIGVVKAGAGLGYAHTNNTTNTVTDSQEVSATVVPLKSFIDDPDHHFQWNFAWYKYQLEGQTFPVLQYVVQKVK